MKPEMSHEEAVEYANLSSKVILAYHQFFENVMDAVLDTVRDEAGLDGRFTERDIQEFILEAALEAQENDEPVDLDGKIVAFATLLRHTLEVDLGLKLEEVTK